MSSVFGHSFIGWAIFNKSHHNQGKYLDRICWLCWYILIAIAPDFDYLIPFLHPSANEGLRITHSLAFSLILPLLTLVYLFTNDRYKPEIKKYILPLIFAGLSNLIMDLLVGVTALPLLYPFSDRTLKLPFGILPSAGKISFSNYYFYRNLIIELGVLIPLNYCFLLITNKQKITTKKLTYILISGVISIYFMWVSYNLSRYVL